MTSVCMYFKVHQPFTFRNYSFFEIGAHAQYENEDVNCNKALKLARECYLPANQVLLDAIKEHKGKFKVSFSISGVTLDLFENHAPEVLDSFKALAETGCVEFLAETYYNSLSFLYSEQEFGEQVAMHAKRIKELFNLSPKAICNTELIYNNDLAKWAEKAGYKVIVAEGAEFALAWRSPNSIYRPEGCKTIRLLMRNTALSDDIALRFSEENWAGYPLDAAKYANWLHNADKSSRVINLFLNYEVFGLYQSKNTGIFEFLRVLPAEIMKNSNFDFKTISETSRLSVVGQVDVPTPMSWTDIEKDLNTWRGNDMQHDALNSCYALENAKKSINNEEMLYKWRVLQGAEHLQAMSTKWFSNPIGAEYHNVYESPYDAYINYMNILSDITLRSRVNKTDNTKVNEEKAVKAKTKKPTQTVKKKANSNTKNKTKTKKFPSVIEEKLPTGRRVSLNGGEARKEQAA